MFISGTLSKATMSGSTTRFPDCSESVTPDMPSPLLDEAGLDRVILVQAVVADNETRHMLKLAEDLDFIKGVISRP